MGPLAMDAGRRSLARGQEAHSCFRETPQRLDFRLGKRGPQEACHGNRALCAASNYGCGLPGNYRLRDPREIRALERGAIRLSCKLQYWLVVGAGESAFSRKALTARGCPIGGYQSKHSALDR